MPDDQTTRLRSARMPLRCVTCGGTGWQWLMRSWFTEDGYRRERCGICAGTGSSDYRDDAAFVRRQAERRKLMEGANAAA